LGFSVTKFAGDAILVVFRNRPRHLSSINIRKAEKIMGSDESNKILVLRAVACCLTLIAKYSNFSPAEGIRLTIHCGIGVGTMSQIFVGGVENDWEFFVAGAPVKEMCDAATEAQSGQLVISPSACALLNDQYVGSKLPSGYFRLESLVDVPVLPRSSPPKIDASQEEALASFVPNPPCRFNRCDQSFRKPKFTSKAC